VRTDLTSAETEMFLDQIDFEMGGFETSLDVVQTALNHGLAVSLKTGEAIPFGLLQFIELTGLSVLTAHGLVGSMSRRGNPYDNAKAERSRR
jgi:transposase InsO family protein